MNEFMTSYLEESDKINKEAATKATFRFSEKISKITRDGFRELGVIESETNSLRLTVGDEIAALLNKIKDIYGQLFAISRKAMSDLVQFTINNDQELAAKNQAELMRIGS